MDHVLSNKAKPVPRIDSGKVHMEYKVIKCLDEFVKKLLGIPKICDVRLALSFNLILAEEIPIRPRAKVWSRHI